MSITVNRVSGYGVRYLSTASGAVKANNAGVPANSILFSMIQPTGKLHLGNYLGAINNWKDLQQSQSEGCTYIYGIADLHAITVPSKAEVLRKNRHEVVASILAAGLDENKCILYQQSSVPEHTELSWILTCLTSMGQLNRMTQWKLKSLQAASSSIFDDKVLGNTKAGLLCYPVLQAADILLYKSTHVPVGDDQTQHLELCRSIASTFNHTYQAGFFPLPKTLLTPSKKILSLRDPSRKMSKSDPDPNACIYVTDDPKTIMQKVRRAVTDSVQGPITFDPENRPGVSNMVNIIASLRNSTVQETASYLLFVKDHKQLKDVLSEFLIEEFKPKRHLFDKLLTDKSYIEQICAKGTLKAREIASRNIASVKSVVGFD